jgi:hypothetical protein
MLHLFHYFRLEIDLASATGRAHSAALLQAVVPSVDPDVPKALARFAASMSSTESEVSSAVSSQVTHCGASVSCARALG